MLPARATDAVSFAFTFAEKTASMSVSRTADISAECASASAAVVKFTTPGTFSDAASECTTAPTVSALPMHHMHQRSCVHA